MSSKSKLNNLRTRMKFKAMNLVYRYVLHYPFSDCGMENFVVYRVNNRNKIKNRFVYSPPNKYRITVKRNKEYRDECSIDQITNTHSF